MKSSSAARRKARRFVLQALYQVEMTGDSAIVVEQQFRAEKEMQGTDMAYFHELLSGTMQHRTPLLESVGPLSNRKLEELDPVEKAILLIGSFELTHRVEIPYRVVISEAVELAKKFGATESHRFINSVLDALAKINRQYELDKSN